MRDKQVSGHAALECMQHCCCTSTVTNMLPQPSVRTHSSDSHVAQYVQIATISRVLKVPDAIS